MKYQLNINDQFDFELEANASDLDIQIIDDGEYHILKNNQAYHARLIESDFQNKTLTLQINGTNYRIKIADEYDQLVKKLGLSVSASQKIKNVKAPMPGLVLEVLAEAGQEVNKGDGLLILEAMKMENVIKASGEGVVKAINVEKGKTVEKGELLLEME